MTSKAGFSRSEKSTVTTPVYCALFNKHFDQRSVFCYQHKRKSGVFYRTS